MSNNINKYAPHLFLALYVILFINCGVNPFNRAVWVAENIPVVIPVLLLIFTYKKFRFSNLSYFLMWFFMSLHTIGGHYTFELVPFDFINELLAKLDVQFLFPNGRNNFDRVGHFFVGVFAYPLAEFTYRKKYINSIYTAILFGIFALGFWGALYEAIEMIYAIKEGGEAGSAFLGSQGDVWDAQKDMLLDIYGAIAVSVLFYFVWSKKSIS
jgi:putative membrane protein